MTLMELMLVIVILGILMGVAVGGFASFDPGQRAARGLIANTLRQARNDAVAHRAPSRVIFDPTNQTVRTEGYAVAGTWRFETASLKGANEANGTPSGFADTFLSDEGFIGKALDLSYGGRGARVVFDIGSDPIFNVRRGFRMSAALRAASLSDSAIVNLGGVVTMAARTDGSVEFSVITRQTDELGRSRAGEQLQLRTTPGVLTPDRWVEVELSYDRRRLTATANGVPVAERVESRELWDLDGKLTVGGGRRAFVGRVDDLVLSVARAEDSIRLPSAASFAALKPFEVRFDEGGRLDPVVHPDPVEIELSFQDGSSESLRVLRMGTVE